VPADPVMIVYGSEMIGFSGSRVAASAGELPSVLGW